MPKRLAIFAAVWTVLAAAAWLAHYATARVEVAFEADVAAPGVARVYYARKSAQQFKEVQSAEVALLPGRREYTVKLQAFRVEAVCIEFADASGGAALGPVLVHGHKRREIPPELMRAPEGVEARIEGGWLHVASPRPGVRIESPRGLHVRPRALPEKWKAWAIAALLALAAWKLSASGALRRGNRAHLPFAAAAAALCIFPLTEISDDAASAAENRKLAEFPQIRRAAERGYDFGKRFEHWFGDRFAGREQFVALWRALTFGGSDKVLRGKDGWLFSRVFGEERMFRNANRFTAAQLERAAARAERFAAAATAAGVKATYFYLAADKESVYPEFYPDGYAKEHPESRREQLARALAAAAPQARTLDFTARMLELKKVHPLLCCKAGTHYNQLGSFFEYSFLCEAIGADFPQLKILREDDFVRGEDDDQDHWLADAGVAFYSRKNLRNPSLALKQASARVESVRSRSELGETVKFYRNAHSGNNLRMVLVSDSFAQHWAAYFAEGVAELCHIFAGSGMDFTIHPEEAEWLRANPPDILLVESTERFLQRFLSLEYPAGEGK